VHPWLRPAVRHDTIYDIDPAVLVARGMRGLILDFDNTIVPWGACEAPPALAGWLRGARAAGLQLCIVSNSGGHRVVTLARALDVPVLTYAWKPWRGKLRRALAVMGTTAATTALVGDDPLTDGLGGNWLGLYTILVRPKTNISRPTRFVRVVQQAVLQSWRWAGAKSRRRCDGRPP